VADKNENTSESSGLADILAIANAIEEEVTSPRIEPPSSVRPATAAVPLAPTAPHAALPRERENSASWETDPGIVPGALRPPRSRDRSRTVLWLAIGGLSLAASGGFAAVMLRAPQATQAPSTAYAGVVGTPSTPAAEASPAVAAPPAAVAVPSSGGEAAAVAPPSVPEATPAAIHAPAAPETEEGPTAEPAPPQREASRSIAARKPKSAPTRALPARTGDAALPPEPSPSAAKSPTAAPVDPGKKFSTECLLDPSTAGCNAPKASAPSMATAGPRAQDLSATLPEKLTQSQIRDGIDAVKDRAKACGTQHGAPDGTTVRVKLSIAGSSGRVTSASADEPHAGQPLGQCVANALKGASFPRFKSDAQGTTFPVKL